MHFDLILTQFPRKLRAVPSDVSEVVNSILCFCYSVDSVLIIYVLCGGKKGGFRVLQEWAFQARKGQTETKILTMKKKKKLLQGIPPPKQMNIKVTW